MPIGSSEGTTIGEAEVDIVLRAIAWVGGVHVSHPNGLQPVDKFGRSNVGQGLVRRRRDGSPGVQDKKPEQDEGPSGCWGWGGHGARGGIRMTMAPRPATPLAARAGRLRGASTLTRAADTAFLVLHMPPVRPASSAALGAVIAASVVIVSSPRAPRGH
ncbi:MAG TPA: hypothetical protein VGG37_06490 [Opitutaceae bacterium]